MPVQLSRIARHVGTFIQIYAACRYIYPDLRSMPVHLSTSAQHADTFVVAARSPLACHTPEDSWPNRAMVEVANPLRLVYTAVCVNIFFRACDKLYCRTYNAHENVIHMQTL